MSETEWITSPFKLLSTYDIFNFANFLHVSAIYKKIILEAL